MDIKNHYVSIETRLRSGQSGVRNPVDVRDFPFFQKVQNSSGTNPASYSIRTTTHFRGLRGPSVKELTPSIAEIKNEWNYTSNPLHMPSRLEQGKF